MCMLRVSLHDAEIYYDESGKVTLVLGAYGPYDNRMEVRTKTNNSVTWR